MDAAGEKHTTVAAHVISSAPMRELGARGSRPRSPSTRSRAAAQLRYRDFLTVVLILKDSDLFDDNWIYIHDPSVKVGRIQNFKSWSPEMVPDPVLAIPEPVGRLARTVRNDGPGAPPEPQVLQADPPPSPPVRCVVRGGHGSCFRPGS